MLLHGGESVNDKSESDDSDTHRKQGVSGIMPSHHEQAPWNLEGRALSALNRFGENARTVSGPTWLRRVQHQQAIIEPPSNFSIGPSFFGKSRHSFYAILSDKNMYVFMLSQHQ